jgi:hypothetical protein
MKRKETSPEVEVKEKSEKKSRSTVAELFLPIITCLKVQSLGTFFVVSFGVCSSNDSSSPNCRILEDSYVLGNDLSKISWMEREDLVANPLDRKNLIRHFVRESNAQPIELPLTNINDLSAGRLQHVDLEKINYNSRARIFKDCFDKKFQPIKGKKYVSSYLESPSVKFLDIIDAGATSIANPIDYDALVSKYSLYSMEKEWIETYKLYDTIVPRGEKIRASDWYINIIYNETLVVLAKTFDTFKHAESMLIELMEDYNFPSDSADFYVDGKINNNAKFLFEHMAIGIKQVELSLETSF